MPYDFGCSVALPYAAMGWSALRDYGTSGSYSLAFLKLDSCFCLRDRLDLYWIAIHLESCLDLIIPN